MFELVHYPSHNGLLSPSPSPTAHWHKGWKISQKKPQTKKPHTILETKTISKTDQIHVDADTQNMNLSSLCILTFPFPCHFSSRLFLYSNSISNFHSFWCSLWSWCNSRTSLSILFWPFSQKCLQMIRKGSRPCCSTFLNTKLLQLPVDPNHSEFYYPPLYCLTP